MFFKKKHDKIQKVAEDKKPISHEGFKLTIHTENDGTKFNSLSAAFGISSERRAQLEKEVDKVLDSNGKNQETAYNSVYLKEMAKFCHNLEELAYVTFGLGQIVGRAEGGMGGARMIHIQLGGMGQSSMNQQEDEDNDNSIDALIKRSEKINGKYGEPKKDDDGK